MKRDVLRAVQRQVVAVCAVMGLMAGATAQTVYRCGPEGRAYSHQPCADGRAVPASDARTPSQRSEATDATRREALTAEGLERERRRREALAARTGPAGFRTAPVHRAEAATTASKRTSKTSAKTKTVRKAPKTAPSTSTARPKSA